MPYIPPETKRSFEHALHDLDILIEAPGELTYVIFVLARRKLMRDGVGYANMSAVRASIQDAADEFYRRLMVPYEIKKMSINGDAV